MLDPLALNTLRQFRAGVYDCFGARRDALFELLDAATVAGLVPSLALSGGKTSVGSGNSFVGVMQPVQHWPRVDRASYWSRSGLRRLQSERAMRAILVVVRHEFTEDR